MIIARLPPYPSVHARRQLPASQLISLNRIIASTLSQIIALPPEKRDSEILRVYVKSYARDASSRALQALIWGSQDNTRLSSDEELIRKYTIQLAERIVSNLDLEILLDLAIGYSTSKECKLKLRALLKAAAETRRHIHETIEDDLVPALVLLLSPPSSNQNQGLYGLRKIAHCIVSFLRVSPDSFVRLFAHSKSFLLGLAHAYQNSLPCIATSYGGISVLQNAVNRPLETGIDEWERIWVDTKIALIDAFHIVFSRMVEDIISAEERSLGIEVERTFDIVFALLEQSSSFPSTSTVPLTPFLNRPLLSDYHQSYSLSHMLISALKHTQEKDARLDVIEAALANLGSSGPERKEPGALKIILRSYGIQEGIDNRGSRAKYQMVDASIPRSVSLSNSSSPKKGKGKALEPVEDPELDMKVSQVLDVLPDVSASYVRLLLESDKYQGELERVLSALLEGSVPSEEALLSEIKQSGQSSHTHGSTGSYALSQRLNVFDSQDMDPSRLRSGKKSLEYVFSVSFSLKLTMVHVAIVFWETDLLSVR